MGVAPGGTDSHPCLPRERDGGGGGKHAPQRSDLDGNIISRYSCSLPSRTRESGDNAGLPRRRGPLGGGPGGRQRGSGPGRQRGARPPPSGTALRSPPRGAGPQTRNSRLAPAPRTPLPPPNFLLQGRGAPRAVTSRGARGGGCPARPPPPRSGGKALGRRRPRQTSPGRAGAGSAPR